MEIRELLEQYKEARELRSKLEAKAKELKAQVEEPLQNQILQKMLEEGISSVKIPGLANAVKTSKSHYEIVDREVFARAFYEGLKAAEAQGRPLCDAFITQFRVSKDVFTELYGDVKDLSSLGVVLIEKPELSIRKA